jgi:sugar phosphate isomerase/epimerase
MAENVMFDNYYSSLDREYHAEKEGPSIGVTAHEAAEGRFPQSVAAKIKAGADAVELQLTDEDVGKGWGAEAYGKEARQDIRELAEMNEVKIHSIHMPIRIHNLSGLGERGFNETQRDHILNEVRKHLDFASDVAEKGASVVIHTGEFPRPISGRYKEFMAYPGEEKETVNYLADEESGQTFQPIRSDMEVTIMKQQKDEQGELQPIWKIENREPEVDRDFETVTVNQYREQLAGRAKELKSLRKAKLEFIKEHGLAKYKARFEQRNQNVVAEELVNLDQNELTSLGLFIDMQNNKLLDAQSNVEYYQSEYERFNEQAQELRGMNRNEEAERMQRIADSQRARVAAVKQQIAETQKNLSHIVPISQVAMSRTADTLAQAGIIAMQKTKEKKLKGPLYMTPENISPLEFGSHPNEMINIVEAGRKRMVELMTNPGIKDMKGRPIDNPYYQKGVTKEKAEEIAKQHIKATLDTQHLGMWRRHFQRNPGETEAQRDKRFNKWYLDQVDKLADKGIIGNVHLVDGMGLGHTHLPAMQGNNPVSEAIEKLRAKGYTQSISSEGHGEGPERQLQSAWAAAGKATGLYHGATQRAMSWTEVENSYFGSQKYPPGYIVGDFAKKISPDFTLWSGVPFE